MGLGLDEIALDEMVRSLRSETAQGTLVLKLPRSNQIAPRRAKPERQGFASILARLLIAPIRRQKDAMARPDWRLCAAAFQHVLCMLEVLEASRQRGDVQSANVLYAVLALDRF